MSSMEELLNSISYIKPRIINVFYYILDDWYIVPKSITLFFFKLFFNFYIANIFSKIIEKTDKLQILIILIKRSIIYTNIYRNYIFSSSFHFIHKEFTGFLDTHDAFLISIQTTFLPVIEVSAYTRFFIDYII